MKPQPTFKKFVEAVLQVLIRNEGSTNSKFVHFVSDQCLENDIKNIEWNRRGANEFHEVKIYKQDQSISQWFKYLSTGSKVDKSVPGNITFVIGYENKCHKIYLNDQITEVVVSLLPEMYSNQEEVDTRILLHCKYINTSSEKIVISCSDRDVFVFSLYFCMGIPSKLYFHRCKG